MKNLNLLFLLAGSAAFAVNAHAASISGTLNSDTFLREDFPTDDWGDDPDGEVLVGFLGSDSIHLMLDFSFDLTPLALNPGDTVVVNSVTFTGTTLSGNTGSGSDLDIDVYEYGFDFSKGDATWDDPTAGVADDDNTAGGTFGPTLLSQVTMNPQNTNTTITFSDTAAFRTALAAQLNGDGDFNLIMEGTNGTGSNLFARFQDFDNTSPFALTADVSVTPVPEPSAFAFLLGIASMAVLARRRIR
jgi:hypothetical protein